MALQKYTKQELTKHLRITAMEAESLHDDGTVINKAEALARLLWKKALGYTAKVRPDDPCDTTFPPEAWAIQLIYERLEGKVPQTTIDEGGKLTAAERVSDLARQRINNLAVVGATKSHIPKPPKLPRK